MKVRDIMHKGATCVESDTPMREIARCMRDCDVGAIPVKSKDQIIGIVTDRDIACAIADGGDIEKMTAQDIMSENVVCCSPEDDVDAAVELMERSQIRRLPVIEAQGGMIGMLSLGDISHQAGAKISSEVLRAVSAHHA